MEHHLRIAETLTFFLENRFSIGKYRFGLDPVLGLIPGIGNIATMILSFYLIWIGMRMNLPDEKIAQMVRNVVVDFVIGIIPVIGKFGDFFYRANSKNLRIIKDHAPRVVEAAIISK